VLIIKRHLSRRTILRGAGTALALPLLDAMIPALRADRITAAAPVRRLGFIVYPLGVDEERWKPKGEGASYELSEALAPLARHREKFVVLGGVSSDPDRTKAGFHDRAVASFMTGVEPTKGKVHVGISVDQVAAKVLGLLLSNWPPKTASPTSSLGRYSKAKLCPSRLSTIPGFFSSGSSAIARKSILAPALHARPQTRVLLM
jgi:hypothetical protein